MANELGLPVPPGFTITTEACRAYLAGSGQPAWTRSCARMSRGSASGWVGEFGDARDPLLVSVRSGAPVSMPGMMDTILNLGLTDGDERGAGAPRPAPPSSRPTACADFARATAPSSGSTRSRTIRGCSCASAIEAVFRSWNGDRARAYRAREGIADDLARR